jgi:hypothetical protein
MITLKSNAATKWFSLYIRLRDGLRCQFCLREFPLQMLDCSHWISRGSSLSVKFEPDNCVALCRPHHVELGNDPTLYRAFMLTRLGSARYWELIRISKMTVKYLDLVSVAERFRKLARAFPDCPGRRAALSGPGV